MPDFLNGVANTIGSAVKQAATHSARAAATANGVSWASQAAQGAFNQQSANIANGLGTDRILGQYDFNSGQAAAANAFTEAMWDKSAAYNSEAWERAAAWNEAMIERQMEFNHNEAALNRQWQQSMAETNYQRAVADMEKAGLNPILASGGVSVGSGGGSAASIGSTSMGSPQMHGSNGAMASGGLLNGVSASEGNFSGQMEYMAGWLGLIAAAVDGIGTAMKVFNSNEMKEIVDNAFHLTNEKSPNTPANRIREWWYKKTHKGSSQWDNGNYNPYDEPGVKW